MNNNTGTITYNPNNAGFTVVSPNAMPLENDPTVRFQTTTGQTTSQTAAGSQVNTQQITPLKFPGTPPPPPPDTSNLSSIEQSVRRKAAITAAMQQYDQLSAATQATGFQAANNAGNVYAQRSIQQGINPLASGVVAAQARLPVYKQLADIGVQKEQTRLDANNKADTLAAQIATNIGQLQQSYASMLADYNAKQTGYNLDFTKFQSSGEQESYQYENDYRLKVAQLAAQQQAAQLASGGSGGRGSSALPAFMTRPGFDPGYLTNDGPIHGSSVNPNVVYMGAARY